MPTELLKCLNLIGDRIANTSAQTIGDLWILLGSLLSQREFRCDRHAVNGTQAGYEGKLSEPLSV
jgi:isocitrate dehydrogenase